ncbi:MAG TPA: tail fiber domain-containing protein, partial [Ferruginibacter sp.]|nr:tail fiber domain-containing protein [Ferruginibacter sp.]
INTSDARDKENISDLNYGLNEIMKLRPVSFTWKENPQWGKKIGFIAQEVKPVLSEVVQVGTLKTKAEAKNDQGNALNKNSDKLGIYYSDIIPVTVKAIQEQQLLINKQQKTIDSQQKAIAELMERIKKLENK